MTEQDQQTAIQIATSLGWKKLMYLQLGLSTSDEEGIYGWCPGDEEGTYASLCPDWLNDLNATHELEKTLTPEQEHLYVDRLAAALMSAAYEDDPRWLKSELSSYDSTYRATARQRCTAYLEVVKTKTQTE